MRSSVVLSLALLACGGAAAEGPPKAPGTKPTPGPSTSGTAATTKPAVPAGVVLAAPRATQMEAELREIGLDPAALPVLSKLPPQQLRRVMKTFTKSLGVPCAGCHDTNDFRAATPQKTIATHMWNDFTRGLAFEDGRPLYCDSCHDGRKALLDRRDKKALGHQMEEAFVKPLKRTDGQDHGCETCHGASFEGEIFAKLWK